MRALSKILRIAGLTTIAALTACGGGGGGPASKSGGGTPPPPPPPGAANVLAVDVGPGPDTAQGADINTLFTTVTVCVPGSTTQCQTITNIQVDTGSFGLRLIASAVTLTLPVETIGAGNTLVECTQFADGYSWGSVVTADLQIAGETASAVPVQVIGSSGIPAAPSTCSGTGLAENTVAQFGANGLLGVGIFAQDCGPSCVAVGSSSDAYSSYYACSASACLPSGTGTLTAQVTNPVTLFAVDNNGVIITLASVPANGAVSVTGTMTFGVDTESNNKSGTQSVVALDADDGAFTTTFNSQSLSDSVFDTGSNGYYFADSSIIQCSGDFAGFYCPSSPLSLSASVQGQDDNGDAVGTSYPVAFSVASAESLSTSEPSYIAFSNLAGVPPTSGNAGLTNAFDWGLPFYYGNTVYTVFEGYSSSVASGPYVAF
jgi:uncharacterized protein DUF3443